MKILEILGGSLHLLKEKPVLFLPNFFASSLYAVYELLIIFLAVDSLSALQDPAGIDISSFLWLLGVFPFIAVVDLVTYSMYPSLVSDFRKEGKISLWKALSDALRAWRVWMSLGAILLLLAFFAAIPVALSAFAAFYLGNPLYLLIGAFVFLFLAVFIMLAVFFVVPIGVIEGSGVVECFRRSCGLGLKHAREVVALNLSIVLLVAAALFIGNLQSVKGVEGLTVAAVSLFLLTKLVQSMVYTYVCVVTPFFYVECR